MRVGTSTTSTGEWLFCMARPRLDSDLELSPRLLPCGEWVRSDIGWTEVGVGPGCTPGRSGLPKPWGVTSRLRLPVLSHPDSETRRVSRTLPCKRCPAVRSDDPHPSFPPHRTTSTLFPLGGLASHPARRGSVERWRESSTHKSQQAVRSRRFPSQTAAPGWTPQITYRWDSHGDAVQ